MKNTFLLVKRERNDSFLLRNFFNFCFSHNFFDRIDHLSDFNWAKKWKLAEDKPIWVYLSLLLNLLQLNYGKPQIWQLCCENIKRHSESKSVTFKWQIQRQNSDIYDMINANVIWMKDFFIAKYIKMLWIVDFFPFSRFSRDEFQIYSLPINFINGGNSNHFHMGTIYCWTSFSQHQCSLSRWGFFLFILSILKTKF